MVMRWSLGFHHVPLSGKVLMLGFIVFYGIMIVTWSLTKE